MRMRLDPLNNLIANTDFLSFREIALQCLDLKGYKDLALTDGWNDGGVDVRFCVMPPNVSKIAIQISVEKEWKKKLKRDARKIKKQFGLNRMIFVSSRRLDNVEFEEVSESIWNELEVSVSKLDCQGIATTFFNLNKTECILEILNISTEHDSVPNAKFFNPKAEVASSLFFFGRESNELRKGIINSTLISVLALSNQSLERNTLIERVLSTLQFQQRQNSAIDGEIDRMLQSGDLTSFRGRIKLNPQLFTAYNTKAALREKDFSDLKAKISQHTIYISKKSVLSDEDLNQILEVAGALIIDASLNITKQMTAKGYKMESLTYPVKKKIIALNAILDRVNFPLGEEREKLFKFITRELSVSEIGKNLLVGEILTTLCNMTSQHLTNALGGVTGINVMLDASVAIPILCTLLYEPTGDRFGFASKDFYELALRNSIKLALPLDYLQETAAHLIWAFRNYKGLIYDDPDLCASENAFVAHYVSLHSYADEIDFDSYLESFGFSKKMQTRDLYDYKVFNATRDELMPILQHLFERNNITIRPLTPNEKSLKKAQMAISFAMNELNIVRSDIVTKHDTRTIAHLIQQDRHADYCNILCTWDSLHFKVKSDTGGTWDTFDPAVFSDLLSICVQSEDNRMLSTPINILKSFSELSMRNAAYIWETIIGFEKKGIHNAQLIQAAKEFKEVYLAERNKAFNHKKIIEEWKKWKLSRDV